MFSNLIKYSIKDQHAGIAFPYASLSLQVLLNNLVNQLAEITAINNIMVQNEIPSEFKVLADQQQVTSLINELLTAIVMNARNTRLYISAEKFIDTITLSVEDRNNYNGYALSFSLMALEKQVRFVGGDLTISGAQKRITVVSLSFPATPGCLYCV